MRECRQEGVTDVPDTRNNNTYLDGAPESILQDESSTSEPDTDNVRFLQDARSLMVELTHVTGSYSSRVFEYFNL